MTSTRESEHQIKSYLANHHLAVLATVDHDHHPSAAVVGYTCLDGLRLVIATYTSSRKYAHLRHDHHVALTVGWEQGRTLQYEGLAQEAALSERATLQEQHYAQVPTIAKYIDMARQVIYVITPTWIRLTSYETEPWTVTEVMY